MARSGITYEDVQNACELIVERGDYSKVTLTAVRAELGTGSNSTINKHVRKWREEHRQKIQSLRTKIGVSDDFIQAMQNEIGAHTDTQKRDFEEQLTASADEAQEASQALEEAEESIEKQKQDFAAQLQDATNTIAQRDQQFAVQESMIGEKEAQLEALNTKHETVIQSGFTLEKDNAVALARIESLEAQISVLQNTLSTTEDNAREANHSLEDAKRTIENQKQNFADQLQGATDAIASRDQQLAGQQSVNDEKEKQIKALDTKYEQAVQNAFNLEKENVVGLSRIESLGGQIGLLRDTLAGKEQKIDKLQEKAFELDKKLALANK